MDDVNSISDLVRPSSALARVVICALQCPRDFVAASAISDVPATRETRAPSQMVTVICWCVQVWEMVGECACF